MARSSCIQKIILASVKMVRWILEINQVEVKSTKLMWSHEYMETHLHSSVRTHNLCTNAGPCLILISPYHYIY
jgi:hypothetical protein